MDFGVHGCPGTSLPWMLRDNRVWGSQKLHTWIVYVRGVGTPLLSLLFKGHL